MPRHFENARPVRRIDDPTYNKLRNLGTKLHVEWASKHPESRQALQVTAPPQRPYAAPQRARSAREVIMSLPQSETRPAVVREALAAVALGDIEVPAQSPPIEPPIALAHATVMNVE